MTKIDYYTLVLALVNLYFLEKILFSFSVTNLIALFDNKFAVGYVALIVAIIGILFTVRNCARMVTYLSGNSLDETKFIRSLALETLLVIISYIVLAVANTIVYYMFNAML